MRTGFRVIGAKSKRDKDATPPVAEPMKAGQSPAERRNPTTDELNARRKLRQRTATARKPPTGRSSYKPGQSRMGEHTPQSHPHEFSNEDLRAEIKHLTGLEKRRGDPYGHYAGARLKLFNEIGKRGPKAPKGASMRHQASDTKEGSMNSIHREADLLEAMARATLPEQRRLVAELNTLRATGRIEREASASLDLANAVIHDHLTPVMVHEHHTAATDWVGEMDTTTDADVHSHMLTEASLWFTKTSAEVKADRDEYAEQAWGTARRHASAFGERAEEAECTFLDHVAFLHARHVVAAGDGPDGDYEPSEDEIDDATSDFEPWPDGDEGPEKPDVTAWDDEVTTGESSPSVEGSRRVTAVICPKCKGTPGYACDTCHGKGTVPADHPHVVRHAPNPNNGMGGRGGSRRVAADEGRMWKTMPRTRKVFDSLGREIREGVDDFEEARGIGHDIDHDVYNSIPHRRHAADQKDDHLQSGQGVSSLPTEPEGDDVDEHQDFLTDYPDTGPTERHPPMPFPGSGGHDDEGIKEGRRYQAFDEKAIDDAVKDEVGGFHCPKCGERNRVGFYSGDNPTAHCDACGNRWNPPPPWAQPKSGSRFQADKFNTHEQSGQGESTLDEDGSGLDWTHPMWPWDPEPVPSGAADVADAKFPYGDKSASMHTADGWPPDLWDGNPETDPGNPDEDGLFDEDDDDDDDDDASPDEEDALEAHDYHTTPDLRCPYCYRSVFGGRVADDDDGDNDLRDIHDGNGDGDEHQAWHDYDDPHFFDRKHANQGAPEPMQLRPELANPQDTDLGSTLPSGDDIGGREVPGGAARPGGPPPYQAAPPLPTKAAAFRSLVQANLRSGR